MVKEQKFISQNSEGWESKIQDPTDFVSLLCPQIASREGRGERESKLSCVSSYKVTNPIHEVAAFMT